MELRRMKRQEISSLQQREDWRNCSKQTGRHFWARMWSLCQAAPDGPPVQSGSGNWRSYGHRIWNRQPTTLCQRLRQFINQLQIVTKRVPSTYVYKRVVLAGPDPCVGQASAKKLCEAHGKNKACFLPLNVCCPKQFEGVLCEVIARFGSVDMLVNNAGLLDEKKWELEIDVNLKGVIHGTLLAIPRMKNQKHGGVIVNISSERALAGCPSAPIFAASKAGVNIFSKGIGGSVKDAVRIAALAPGTTDTPMLKDLSSKTMFPPSGDGGSKQRPDAVGRAVVYLVQYAESGSIWLAEDAQLYKANWPHKTSYFEKITTL